VYTCVLLRFWHNLATAAVAAAAIAAPPLPVPPGSFDGLVMVWDIGTGQPLHTYKGHQYQVTAVALLPTGDIASASVDK
jgi:WD40 repeat protein